MNLNKKTVTILLVGILLLGAVLRLWQLGAVPSSPDWDEAALAYNAHSIAQTGRDEYGAFMPIVLRSFDDFKPAFYSYLAIPSVELFGLNNFAVRLPSAIMGLIAILGTYFLVKELFRNRGNHAEIIALLAAFFLAISPWHIQFSRVAFETNVGLTFNILTALFFLKGLKNPWYLLGSAFFAGINISVYHSERVFTPLLVLTLAIIYHKELFRIPKKFLIITVLIGFLAALPTLYYVTTNQQALQRLQGTSAIGSGKLLDRTTLRLHEDKEQNDLFGQLINNRRVVYVKTIADGYISHFDPKWLFLAGDADRHHAPQMGLLYLIALPFILVGMYQLLFGKFDRKTKWFIFSWFLLAAVPASITSGVPHAVRTLNFLPTYQIFEALGIIAAFLFIIKYRFKIILYIVFLLLASFNFAYFLNQYFVQQNYFHAHDWQYGYEQAVEKVLEEKKNYKKIVVSDTVPLDQSYIFFLYYLNYPPQDYQKRANPTNRDFDVYEFRKIDLGEMEDAKDVLYVGSTIDFPLEEKIVTKHVIRFPNGDPAILFVDPRDNRDRKMK